MKSETTYCVMLRKGAPCLKVENHITSYIPIKTDEYRPYINVLGKIYLPDNIIGEINKLMRADNEGENG